jgi:hypothetical protein
MRACFCTRIIRISRILCWLIAFYTSQGGVSLRTRRFLPGEAISLSPRRRLLRKKTLAVTILFGQSTPDHYRISWILFITFNEKSVFFSQIRSQFPNPEFRLSTIRGPLFREDTFKAYKSLPVDIVHASQTSGEIAPRARIKPAG